MKRTTVKNIIKKQNEKKAIAATIANSELSPEKLDTTRSPVYFCFTETMSKEKLIKKKIELRAPLQQIVNQDEIVNYSWSIYASRSFQIGK